MHRQQSNRLQTLISHHIHGQIRSAATAVATKPKPQSSVSWEAEQSTRREEAGNVPYKANVSKWARPTSEATRTTPISPATSKWARPSGKRLTQLQDKPGESSRPVKKVSANQRLERQVSASLGKWALRTGTIRTDQGNDRTNVRAGRNSTASNADSGRSSTRREGGSSFGLIQKSDILNTDDVELEPVPLENEKTSVAEDDDLTQSYQEPISTEKSHLRSRQQRKTRGSIFDRLNEYSEENQPSMQEMEPVRNVRTKRHKIKQLKPANRDVFIPTFVSVENLARILDVRLESLLSCMRKAGMESQSSFDHILSSEDASLLAMEFDRNPVVDDEAAFDIHPPIPHPNYASLPRRPPVVTIMGHVDHGKTTLLDKLRSTSVAKGEAGGITQHIGAFSVPVPDSSSVDSEAPRTITFLDTPGHAAFSAMRARGARVTDVIVLVVAADDGVMPQTKEVIDLIKKDNGNTGVVVAINKVDKPGADVEKVQNDLLDNGIHLEIMGGEIPSVEVSGLTGQGLDQLIETISALAEMQDLRAERDGHAYGFVLESNIRKGFGNAATVLLLRGSLAPSSYIISGTTYGKVRHLNDSQGKAVRSAYPGDAVIVSGWKDLPRAGDEVIQGQENDVKKAVQNRLRQEELTATLHDAEAINLARQQERERREEAEQVDSSSRSQHPRKPVTKDEDRIKELRLVVKGDVSGSIEAFTAAAEAIGNKDVRVKVISSGVGEVTESDVMMAKAAEGMIVAFAVGVSRTATQSANREAVAIFSSKVIYSILDEVKARAAALLPVIIEKKVTGEANVLQLFDIHKGKETMKVAGCRVSNGLVEKSKKARVIRDGVTIHEGLLQTLRVLKKDVTEVKKGSECGLSFEGFAELKEGDFIQLFQELEKPVQLY